jgi:hypothetical protein
MGRVITESVADAEAGRLTFYREGAGGTPIHALAVFFKTRSDNRPGDTESIDKTLAELVTATTLTAGERTTLQQLLQKVFAGLRGLAGLDP